MGSDGWKKRAVQWAITHAGLATRAMTLGVRAAVVDADGRVLLVRHTYLPGWYLPGGGVETGETLLDAVVREVAEEGDVLVEGAPRLHGVYLNRSVSRRDHVALYVIDRFRVRTPATVPSREIAEARFFARDALPREATDATRRRLDELFAGAPTDPFW